MPNTEKQTASEAAWGEFSAVVKMGTDRASFVAGYTAAEIDIRDREKRMRGALEMCEAELVTLKARLPEP